MSDFKYSSYDTIASALTTELNSLAASAYCAASSAIDNTTNLFLYDDLELVVQFGSNPVVNTPIELYLVPTIDGTNYIDGTTPARNLYVGAFLVQATTSAQRLALRGVPLTPGLFKYVIKNGTAQAMNASGNTLKRRGYRLQVV